MFLLELPILDFGISRWQTSPWCGFNKIKGMGTFDSKIGLKLQLKVAIYLFEKELFF
jgi:hypothetical protein